MSKSAKDRIGVDDDSYLKNLVLNALGEETHEAMRDAEAQSAALLEELRESINSFMQLLRRKGITDNDKFGKDPEIRSALEKIHQLSKHNDLAIELMREAFCHAAIDINDVQQYEEANNINVRSKAKRDMRNTLIIAWIVALCGLGIGVGAYCSESKDIKALVETSRKLNEELRQCQRLKRRDK